MAAVASTQPAEAVDLETEEECRARRERLNSTSSSSFASTSLRRSISSASSVSSTSTTSSSSLLHHKPHKSHQPEWVAIRRLRSSSPGGRVSLDQFRLVRRLGSGDLGNVYLCRLRGLPSPLYAMKVVDRESLLNRKKLQRAETEREILSLLDHPFLPTLYAHFDAAHYSCLLMEFCPGGDLHVARQRQPSGRFSLSSTRFYAAEILVAMEYLHMMGVVYRDLKPENVLVRGDGHIMLSDFDLSLRCDVVPKLVKPANQPGGNAKAPMQPVLSCLLGTHSRGSCRIIRGRTRTTTITTLAHQASPAPTPTKVVEEGADSRDPGDDGEERKESEFKMEPELVAEPITARSMSFVGTHEYLAPEVISGLGHGSAVDWWTLGVFLYELLFGFTPFKGDTNKKTLMNIMKQPLRFPKVTTAGGGETEAMVRAQDLISKLLVKNPKRRIGSLRGAVEIKRHEFFKGVNWALIRSVRPPEVPNEGLLRRQYVNKMAASHDPNHERHFDFF